MRGSRQRSQAESTQFDQAAADAALAKLQDAISTIVQTKGSPRPLLESSARLVEQYPQYAPAQLTYAQVLFLNGQHAQGYEHLKHALDLEPAQPEVEVLAGSTAMRLEDYAAAQRHFAHAVALEPRNTRYHLMLATAQFRQNRYDEARLTLLKAIRIDSGLDAAYALQSDVYKAQNKVGPALDQIDRALSLVEETDADRRAVYLRKKAALLLRANEPEQAMMALRKLPVRRLMDREVSQELAATWMRLQQPEQAAMHYEVVLTGDPTADWAAERAAYYWVQAGDIDRAKQSLAALRRINPRAPQINDLERAIAEQDKSQ